MMNLFIKSFITILTITTFVVVLSPKAGAAAPLCETPVDWDFQSSWQQNGGSGSLLSQSYTLFEFTEDPEFPENAYYVLASHPTHLSLNFSSQPYERVYTTDNVLVQAYDKSSKNLIQSFEMPLDFRVTCVVYSGNSSYVDYTGDFYPPYNPSGGGGNVSKSVLPENTVGDITTRIQQYLLNNMLVVVGVIAVVVAIAFIVRWYYKSTEKVRLGKR